MRDDYFNWLYDVVCPDDRYLKLCRFLHSISFSYDIPMDGNRYEDGISMRFRFGYACDIPSNRIATELDNTPCSMFEMMVALALRMEEDIMACPGENRTSEWFREMIRSLGIAGMTNELFDPDKVEAAVERFLNKDYDRDGKGGLFTVTDTDRDLRTVEIWYQAIWYLNSVLKGEHRI